MILVLFSSSGETYGQVLIWVKFRFWSGFDLGQVWIWVRFGFGLGLDLDQV